MGTVGNANKDGRRRDSTLRVLKKFPEHVSAAKNEPATMRIKDCKIRKWFIEAMPVEE